MGTPGWGKNPGHEVEYSSHKVVGEVLRNIFFVMSFGEKFKATWHALKCGPRVWTLFHVDGLPRQTRCYLWETQRTQTCPRAASLCPADGPGQSGIPGISRHWPQVISQGQRASSRRSEFCGSVCMRAVGCLKLIFGNGQGNVLKFLNKEIWV